MDTVLWSPQYETGIDIIDSQHRELFRKIDKLTLSLYEGEGKTTLKGLLEFLGTYVIEHFKTEEELMSRFAYPDLDMHVKEHRTFMARFAEIQREYDDRGGDTYLAIQVSKDIEAWWKTHVLETDMRYVPYMQSA